MRYVGEFLPVSSLHAPSILHPEPLSADARKAGRLRPAGREHPRAAGGARGRRDPRTQQRVGRLSPGRDRATPDDPLRGIEYVATPNLGAEHILASSAIPALFPAVRVTEPEQAAGWYFDGGPRLNTPIKPALWLGAERVIVIALNSVAASRTRTARSPARLLRRGRAPAARRAGRPAGPGHPHAGQPKRADRGPASPPRMDVLAPASLRASAAARRAGRAGPPGALHLHRARGPLGDRRDRQARLPQALQAPLERPARAICGCWERSSTAVPTRCTASF